ncbi:MAG: hypothetical protein ACRENW_04900, partial [Thermodesulfobacteriota bacterium]
LPLWVVVAGFWIAAGPVGSTLRAMAACGHEAKPDQHSSHSPSPVPADVPCFCSHMTGGTDLLLAPALPVAIEPAPVPAPVYAVPFSLPPSPFPGFDPTPETPPPNRLA